MKEKVFGYMIIGFLLTRRLLFLILIGTLVVFTVNSYMRLAVLLFSLPFYQIPIWLGLYSCVSFIILLRYMILEDFLPVSKKQEKIGFRMYVILSFSNYLALYQFIKPDNWFSNRSFFGLILKTVFGSLPIG